MLPDPSIVLNAFAQRLLSEVSEATIAGYDKFNLQLMAAVLIMIGQEYDRAAARLVEENNALERLFCECASAINDDVLRRDLADAAFVETSLLVHALRERNRRLRALLVRVHAHLESVGTREAAQLCEKIWAELIASTRRRQLDLAL